MSLADKIRIHGRERYVIPARKRGERRFSIRAGDVVNDLGTSGRTPSVCSALKTHQFLRDNGLRLVDSSGPKSGQGTTVTYTYEFVDAGRPVKREDPWLTLRGSLKDIFAKLGGGEAYLRNERSNFYGPGEGK
jgi:hypothetical protein